MGGNKKDGVLDALNQSYSVSKDDIRNNDTYKDINTKN